MATGKSLAHLFCRGGSILLAVSHACLCVFLTLAVANPALPALTSTTGTAMVKKKTALIIYAVQEDAPINAAARRRTVARPIDFGLAYARQLQTLLGHFVFSSVTLKSVRAYRPGEADSYTHVFFIGPNAGSTISPAFLNDVGRTSRTVCWLGGGLSQLAARFDVIRKYGFRVGGADRIAYRRVVYKGVNLEKGDPITFPVEVTDPARVTIRATAVSSSGTVPYIAQSGNLWIVTDNPMSYAGPTDRYLAFADVLHDVVGEDHGQQRSALLRIEDVNPLTKPEQLRAIADVLYRRRIPFVVSLVPFYVDPATQTYISLSERRPVVDALHYMVSRGATIALHGVTHQYHGVTTDDFEFWDAVYRRPIAGETEEFVARRIEEGLAEAFRNNLYPLLWETPHYAASGLAYTVIARYFSSVMEQRLALDDQRTSFFVPYLIHRDPYGQQIVPESLGFVPQDSQSPEDILQAARAHVVVRDVVAGAFFHPFIRLGALERIIKGMEALGYRFQDVRRLDHLVQSPDGAVATGIARIVLKVDQRYLREFVLQPNGEYADQSAGTNRLTGVVRRSVRVPPGSIYVAHLSLVPSDLGRKPGMLGRVRSLLSHLQTSRQALHRSSGRVEEGRAVILWDNDARDRLAREQNGFQSALAAAGVSAARLPFRAVGDGAIKPYNLIVVPHASAQRLSSEEVKAIVDAVRLGSRLITTGQSSLAEALGIRFTGRSIRAKVLRDRLVPTLQVTWATPEDLAEFVPPASAQTVVEEQGSRRPVAVVAQMGAGAYFYLGSLFSDRGGYERFPFAMHHVYRDLGIGTRVRSEALEVFFDPGFRQNVSVERLVVAWRQQGVRVVHAAAWAFYPRYRFDYPRLIRSAHANGILVYAWFALPHLTEDYWVTHPECREKDFDGKDAHPDWRFNLALTDARCRDEVRAVVRSILERYDWDGVNFAEIYFEAAAGFQDARPLTPFHPSARKDFLARHGFDPQSLFAPASRYFWKRNPRALRLFEEFRVEWVVRLHEWALKLADEVRRSKPEGFEVVVTVVDGLSMPVLRRSVAVDVRRIVALRRRYDFAVAAEDPTPMWSQPPWRYARVARLYRRIVPDAGKLLVDINILPFRPAGKGDYPTDQQGGLEALQMVASAAGRARILLYSESTILEPDLQMIPYALASVARKDRRGPEWTIASPSTFAIELDDSDRELFVDGDPWPGVVRGRALLPPGRHRLSSRGGPLYIPRLREQSLKLQRITAPSWTARAVRDGLEVHYSAPTRTILVATRRPFQILLDGSAYRTEALAGDDGFAVMLPAGSHAVKLRSIGSFARWLDLAGYVMVLAISSIGTLGLSALLLICVPRLIRSRRAGQ